MICKFKHTKLVNRSISHKSNEKQAIEFISCRKTMVVFIVIQCCWSEQSRNKMLGICWTYGQSSPCGSCLHLSSWFLEHHLTWSWLRLVSLGIQFGIDSSPLQLLISRVFRAGKNCIQLGRFTIFGRSVNSKVWRDVMIMPLPSSFSVSSSGNFTL